MTPAARDRERGRDRDVALAAATGISLTAAGAGSGTGSGTGAPAGAAEGGDAKGAVSELIARVPLLELPRALLAEAAGVPERADWRRCVAAATDASSGGSGGSEKEEEERATAALRAAFAPFDTVTGADTDSDSD